MPAKDIYHDTVKNALVKDGWTITHDPLKLRLGSRNAFVDLGAEQLIAAERASAKIAVEVKSFIGPSSTHDLEQALGQYQLYRDVLDITEADRVLYVAVTEESFFRVFEDDFGKLVLNNKRVQIIVFDNGNQEIVRWIPAKPTVQS